jgi:ArsR family transcriptional regulator
VVWTTKSTTKGNAMPKNDTENLAAFLKAQMKDKSPKELAALFKMLGDPTRLRLLQVMLTKGTQSVGDLCKKLTLRQPTVSHHLALLRMQGLVVNLRTGKNIFYSVAK